MIKPKKVIIGVTLILFDLAVYLTLSLLLMGYDDFYTESKGEYWSLASMTFSEKIIYIGLNIWNAINLIALAYLTFRVIKWFVVKITNDNILV